MAAVRTNPNSRRGDKDFLTALVELKDGRIESVAVWGEPWAWREKARIYIGGKMKLTTEEKMIIRTAYSEAAGPAVQRRRVATHNYYDDLAGGMEPGTEPSVAPLYRAYKTSITCKRPGYIHNAYRKLPGGVTIGDILSRIISFIDARRRAGVLYRGDDGMKKEGNRC